MRTPKDPRYFQIGALSIFFLIGVLYRDFSIQPSQVVLTFVSGLLTQWIWIRVKRIPSIGFLSSWITCTSLVILLRSDRLWVHPLVACLVMSSKFVLRYQGKHIFNPANIGLILGLLFVPGAWVSPGQWGHDLYWALCFVILGSVVLFRAKFSRITGAFLIFYLGLIALRITWYGYSWAQWPHALQNGSLLLFSFFMISDPKTTPNHPMAQIGFSLLTALLAYTVQFIFYRPNPLLWGLFLASWTLPLWDRLFQATPYEWNTKENSNEELEMARTSISTHAVS